MTIVTILVQRILQDLNAVYQGGNDHEHLLKECLRRGLTLLVGHMHIVGRGAAQS